MKFTASKRVMSCSCQEIGGVALALREDRDEHISAGNLFSAGGLHMHDGAMDDALEARGGLGLAVLIEDQVGTAPYPGNP